MTDITTNEKRDYQKFYERKPDGDFSPEKNKAIVEDTIKKYEEKRAEKQREYKESIEERVDAAMHYIKHLESGGSSPAEKYFGRRELARLRGEKIVKELVNRQKNIWRITEVD